MAFCSIALALGVVGVLATVRGMVWRHRLRHFGPFAFGGGPFAYGGPCGAGAHEFGAHGHGGWGRGEWGGEGYGHRHGHRGFRPFGGFGRSFWLRGILARLDTTPGQEKEIRAALDELKNVGREAKDELLASREAAARAVESETFDEIAMGEATVKFDGATAKAKDAFEAALRRIHATLDARQREQFAALVAQGPRAFRGPFREWDGPPAGPYRGR